LELERCRCRSLREPLSPAREIPPHAIARLRPEAVRDAPVTTVTHSCGWEKAPPNEPSQRARQCT